MTRFWLATFRTPQSAADADAAGAPVLAAGAPNLAIEVLADDAGAEWAVLFSTVDDPAHPRVLSCLMGFASPAKATNVWRDRGFPLVDAMIEHDPQGTIIVTSPHFGDAHPMQYDSWLFTLAGVVLDGRQAQRQQQTLRTQYEQALESPDAAHPAALIMRRQVTWTPARRDARILAEPEPKLKVAGTRSPRLAPFATGGLKPVNAWAGTMSLPTGDEGVKGALLGSVDRKDLFGPPAFRFEDVEVIGFRVDLGAYGRDFTPELERLVEPLNFHLKDSPIWDFRYRAATPILLIELLRYGRMRLKSPSPPLVPQDYQSQHELVVRLLVGKVDDDAAQAHDPATYVPAIFVDNPWSKVVGRDVQGFDKRMASFCVPGRRGPVAVLPDGCMHGQRGAARTPRPLEDISLVRLVEQTGSAQGPAVLELDYSFFEGEDWGSFLQIGVDLTLSTLSFATPRWRDMDFTAPEFSGAFSFSAIMDGLKRLRSVQVCPVVDRGLEPTWITGTFTLDDDFRVALPTGTARLTLHAVEPDPRDPSAPATPDSWNLLCRMLGDGRRADLRLPAGSWYRLQSSMDLTIDDGLEWSRPDVLSLFWP
jgi:hypothetical protein